MIQKFFERGLRLRWNKPPDVMTIMAAKGSTINVNPTVNSLKILELDNQVGHESDPFCVRAKYSPKSGPVAPGTVVSFNWLCYAPGFTTRMPLTSDTLTGFMSGCLIATWREANSPHRYVGHVGTDVNNAQATSDVKRNFLRGMPPQTVRGYDPSAAWSYDEREEASKRKVGKNMYTRPAEVVSLVTSHGHFYSILLFPIQEDQQATNSANTLFVVGGRKPITAPLDYYGIKDKLSK